MDNAAYYSGLIERVKAIRGVREAGAAGTMPGPAEA